MLPLSVLLEQVAVKRGGSWIPVEGADGATTSRSVPLEKARDDALIVCAQSGEVPRPGSVSRCVRSTAAGKVAPAREVYAITYVLNPGDPVEHDSSLSDKNMASIEVPNQDAFFTGPRPDVKTTLCLANRRAPADIRLALGKNTKFRAKTFRHCTLKLTWIRRSVKCWRSR